MSVWSEGDSVVDLQREVLRLREERDEYEEAHDACVNALGKAEARLAAVIALCDFAENETDHGLATYLMSDVVRAAATGETQ